MALSAKRKVFVESYLQCWNGAEAARVAGYSHPRTQACRLLANVDVRSEIQARIDEKVMSADEVLVRLAEIARGEWRAYLTPTGGTDFGALIEDGKAHLVRAIKETNAGKTVEFCDMQAALVQIGKVHGLFRDVQEVTGRDGGPIKTEAVGIEQSERDRAIAALANTLTTHVYRGGGSGDGTLDSTE